MQRWPGIFSLCYYSIMKNLKRYFLVLIALRGCFITNAQKVDSLFFNLYTDSLKKGVHNYINVDGKLSNGQWLPLTDKQVYFSATAGVFSGNNLIVDTAYKGEKIMVRATLKSNPEVWKETTIYFKKHFPNERLKTVEELLGEFPRKNKRNKKSTR